MYFSESIYSDKYIKDSENSKIHIHEKVGAQRLWDLSSAVRPLDNYSQMEQLLLQKSKNTNILKYNCLLQTYKSHKIFFKPVN